MPTWRLEIDLLGVLGAYVMGAGTFMITGLAAILTVALRRGMILSLPGISGGAKGAALVEIMIGGLILAGGISSAVRLF